MTIVTGDTKKPLQYFGLIRIVGWLRWLRRIRKSAGCSLVVSGWVRCVLGGIRCSLWGVGSCLGRISSWLRWIG